MKVRVLWPTAFQFMDEVPEAGAVITIDDEHGKSLVAQGSAEVVATKTERTTAEPGEKRTTGRAKKE